MLALLKATAPIAMLPTNNLTLIGAMALQGLVGEMTLPGATDALAFKTYVCGIGA